MTSVVTANVGATGVTVVGEADVRRVHFGVVGTGTMWAGVSTGFGSGAISIAESTFTDIPGPVSVSEPGANVRIERTRMTGVSNIGMQVTAGKGTLRQSIVQSTTGTAVRAYALGTPSATAVVDHVTALSADGSSSPAFMSAVNAPATAGDATVEVANSIARGYKYGVQQFEPGASTGLAAVTVRHSNLPSTNYAPPATDGALVLSHVIDADPLIASAGDPALSEGSPSIDAADPAATGLFAVDFSGGPRVLDGDLDGVARRDHGALEYLAPPAAVSAPVVTGTPLPVVDASVPAARRRRRWSSRSRAPRRSRPRSARTPASSPRERCASASRATVPGSRFECSLDKGRFKPCRSGAKLKHVERGTHRLRVRAITSSGLRDSTPAVRRFKVR